MAVSIRLTALLGSACGLLAVGICSPACGQESGTAQPEVVPAGAGAPAGYRVEESYPPVRAARDSYLYAEQQRRQAIDRQLQLLLTVQWYSGPAYFPYYYYPYYFTSPGAVYAYGPELRREARSAWRFQRSGYRAVFEPWPLVPGDIYGYPYAYRVPQALGHEKTWTGPNGYAYRPIYEPPAGQQPSEQAAVPSPPRPATIVSPPQPPAPSRPAPETIPAPLPEPSGPREF